MSGPLCPPLTAYHNQPIRHQYGLMTSCISMSRLCHMDNLNLCSYIIYFRYVAVKCNLSKSWAIDLFYHPLLNRWRTIKYMVNACVLGDLGILWPHSPPPLSLSIPGLYVKEPNLPKLCGGPWPLRTVTKADFWSSPIWSLVVTPLVLKSPS